MFVQHMVLAHKLIHAFVLQTTRDQSVQFTCATVFFLTALWCVILMAHVLKLTRVFVITTGKVIFVQFLNALVY